MYRCLNPVVERGTFIGQAELAACLKNEADREVASGSLLSFPESFGGYALL